MPDRHGAVAMTAVACPPFTRGGGHGLGNLCGISIPLNVVSAWSPPERPIGLVPDKTFHWQVSGLFSLS